MIEKRELQIKRDETKRKMAQVLEAVSLGKGGLDRPLEVNKPGTAEVNHHQDLRRDKVNPSRVVSSIGITVLIQSTSVQSEIDSALSRGRLLSQGDSQIPACNCSGGKSLKIRGNHEGRWMSFKNK